MKILSKCTGVIWGCDGEHAPCQAALMEDGSYSGHGCGEPCRWVMKKAGEGEPPFLSSEEALQEIKRITLLAVL